MAKQLGRALLVKIGDAGLTQSRSQSTTRLLM
jgi:hypothetical protein